MSKRIVVVGGGPAAVAAAIDARKADASADVTLLSEEDCEPYEKPPLSKGVLLGKVTSDAAPIAGPNGLAGYGVNARLGVRCTSIDRIAKRLETTAGPLDYDVLVLATGSDVRELSLLPAGMPRVHYLRNAAHARAIKQGLLACRHLVVIGAGLIGLEVAAAAAELGIQVTVVEAMSRLMARTCDDITGAKLLAEHQRRGVVFDFGASVLEVTPQADGKLLIRTTTDGSHFADLVLVGAGVRPNDALAVAAGLVTNDGIIVDRHCRTSDPSILSAGDVTRFATLDGDTRLENWRHAQDQGAVAGRNACGANELYDPVPSYWSEQYDLFIQGIGWPSAAALTVYRPMPDKSSLMFEVMDGRINFALGVNANRDMAAIRRLIERRIPVDPASLGDPLQPLSSFLKARTQQP
jgi:NADPH-dependent 2,4-dienoyl-CoA reductase/sulfur reductase-like enzyme